MRTGCEDFGNENSFDRKKEKNKLRHGLKPDYAIKKLSGLKPIIQKLAKN